MQSAKMAAAQLRPLSSTGLVSVLMSGIMHDIATLFLLQKAKLRRKMQK